ncbi:glycosyltransferase family 4 protein [Methylomonas sp. MO1]|uniref:glycosyltransferase family 4 protein n=1 Tax=Methylomonas sp. MO1 TaxID=3073619 RepID=UPI0028A3F2BE|nr:glycosyltransferase family 4 protein [Methylomonas sp. MO1]MDT4292032.1 glycosyltransferase family 4 protein [Methylomonas sp. MO1]
MHVVLLVIGDMNSVSGGYLYNRKLVSYLRSRGDQVSIISLPPHNYWWLLAENIVGDLLENIAAAKPDILIQDAMVHPAVFYLNRRISKQLGIPLIALVHLLASIDQAPWHSAWLYRIVERRYLQTVDGIIANSQTTLTQIRQLLAGALPPHCIAVPAGDNFADSNIDPAAVLKRALEPGPLRILLVGNVIRRKGLHVLLKALSQLPVKDYQLSVAGRLNMEPCYVAQIKTLIRDAGLNQSASLLGPVQGEALADLYRQHHLLVMPSAYESYGIVYVEAQQFGLPAIGTRSGAAWEIIREGENGYLIEPESHGALANLLHTLHQNRHLLAQLGANALHAYAAQPKWETSCADIRAFLSDQVRAGQSR